MEEALDLSFERLLMMMMKQNDKRREAPIKLDTLTLYTRKLILQLGGSKSASLRTL